MPDEIAIQQTLNTYSVGCTLRDWERVMSVFVDNGIWEVPAIGMRIEGKPGMMAAMKAFVEQMSYFVQINSPAIIAVTGDEATAQSVIRECGKFADRAEALEVLGVYEDDLIRTKDGWKFARRCFRSQGMQQFPLLATTGIQQASG